MFLLRKNIPFLIEVFNYLNSRNPQKYHLIIAGGRGNEENKIKETIQMHKLKNNISVMQNLLNSEISALLNKSNFFCLFSKKQKNEFEGFGIVFIEAMYTKNIVFTSTFPFSAPLRRSLPPPPEIKGFKLLNPYTICSILPICK